jgi:SH3-like domain-containing protein
VAFLLSTSLALSSRNALLKDNRAVVVCNDTTPVHASPDSASKIIRQPSQGVTVRISREHSNWTEVVFADGEMGWIRNAHIEAI